MQKINYNRLKEVLAEQEMSAGDLSRKLGISEVTVIRWCDNKHQPTLEKLNEIAGLLKVNVRLLLVSTQW